MIKVGDRVKRIKRGNYSSNEWIKEKDAVHTIVDYDKEYDNISTSDGLCYSKLYFEDVFTKYTPKNVIGGNIL